MTDMQTESTTIRKYAKDVLPELCKLIGNERKQYTSKTDAISIAVMEAIERRKESDTTRKGDE